jgi:CRISPR system Cascade subunit CasB
MSDSVSTKAPGEEAEATEPAGSEETGLHHAEAAHLIAGRLASDGALGTGERAELRRVSPESPFTPTLWRLLLDYDQDEPPSWWQADEGVWEKQWATLLMAMAHCAGLHDRSVPFGEALYTAGWSELRFARLMEAPPGALRDQTRRVAQYLASKGQAADWTEAARLLFSIGGSDDVAESIRLNISRDYYRAQYEDEEAGDQ